MQNSNNLLMGLTKEQVEDRKAKKLVNNAFSVPSKSVLHIIRDNTITLFNLLNIVLAIFVLFVESYKNMLFLGVIFSNIAIGVIQEIRAKLAVDKLSLISAPKALLVRDGKEISASSDEIVLDDICILSMGMQVCTDCVIINGNCEADESMVTGESDSIPKEIGETLLSGSFITSGKVYAKVDKVGEDNYANKITSGAKYIKKNNSQMLASINWIIKAVSLCIVPIGSALFFKNIFLTEQNFEDGVVKTVGSIIGMIPEGLVLLTSVALAISVIRLAKTKTLVQDMYAIETLARVDVLCLDKTGTITEGSMKVDEIIELKNNSKISSKMALNALAHSLTDSNPTIMAIKDAFTEGTHLHLLHTIPFSSVRKYSAGVFKDVGTFILGATEFILPHVDSQLNAKISSYSENGQRVLLLAHLNEEISDAIPSNANPQPIALILISDKIRKEAPETLNYFYKQGVDIKIISGDNPITVSSIAKKSGLLTADKFIDATTLKTEEELANAIKNYSVFGRVTPQQKHSFIKALQKQGHIVGMTGDGANDVLALKEADCSIAMQSGSDASRNVSSLVLLDSNFASMPKVVAEGRRTINNIERSASLFIVKTIYSFLLAIIQLILNVPSPLMPIQMSMVSFFAIGVPSFMLALEPSYNLVRGRFLTNILKKSVPGGLTVFISISALFIVSKVLDIPADLMSSMATIILGFVSLNILFTVCFPLSRNRFMLLILMTGGIFASITIFSNFFEMAILPISLLIITGIICAGSVAVLLLLMPASRWIIEFFTLFYSPKTITFIRKKPKLLKSLKVFGIIIIASIITWISTAVFDFNRAMRKEKAPIFTLQIEQSHGFRIYDGFGYKVIVDEMSGESEFHIMNKIITTEDMKNTEEEIFILD